MCFEVDEIGSGRFLNYRHTLQLMVFCIRSYKMRTEVPLSLLSRIFVHSVRAVSKNLVFNVAVYHMTINLHSYADGDSIFTYNKINGRL